MAMTKRPTRRVFFAIVMIAMLTVTTGLMADEEDTGGEYSEGYCLNLATRCGDQCLNEWYSCRTFGVNADICQNQYDWCLDDCMGYSGWWCGYRQV